MDFQTFRGSDARDALSHVREALGAAALIESTRHVTNGRSGALSRFFVETVAALSARPPATSPRERRAAAPAGHRSAGRASAAPLAETVQGWSREAEPCRELAQLRLMPDDLAQERPPRDRTRATLAAAGFEGTQACELGTGAARVARSGSRELRVWLRQRVANRITCRSGLSACVDPTSVGKTTTLAKLAARAVLQFERSVRVVSLDTFRMGAVEQWRRHAELIGLSLDVATNPGTFHRVAHGSLDDLILVDTPGGGAGQERTLLDGCLGGLRGIESEVLMVLPAWLRANDAERMLQMNARPAPTGVVITKLDEAEQLGGSMQAPMGSELPIGYLCNGARVPEDIHDAVLDDVLDATFPEKA